jgi:hypothetical protein
MFTATSYNPQVKHVNTASAEQLAQFIRMKAARGDRFLHSEMIGETLVMCWRTKTGYFVQCKYDRAGNRICREFFLNWNDTDNKPFNPWKAN